MTSVFIRFDRLWRLVATGISFTTFGIGCLVVMVAAFPVVRMTSDGRARERLLKGMVHHGFGSFIAGMKMLGVLTYDIRDRDVFAEPGQLIVANHPTLIDVVFLIALIPDADCIVNARLFSNPFTGWVLKAANYISNSDSGDTLKAAESSMARGNSLIIFPEGTRSVPGEPLCLQRGAANIAIRTKRPVRPVAIHCFPSTLTKGSPWYRVPERRVHMTLKPCDLIDVTPYLQARRSVASRQLTRAIKECFVKEALANVRD